MSERKKQKKKKDSDTQEDEKPTKEQYSVAKYLKNKLPQKKTTLLGHKVDYFISSKAVDTLMDSPWASGQNKAPIIFTDRQSIEEYLDIMLQKKFFHRAKKFVQRDFKKTKKDEEGTEEKDKKSAKEDDKKSVEDDKDDDKKAVKGDEKEKDGEKKKKRKVKLDMHLEQIFIDGNDAYVWIYDPIPMRAWLIGAAIVLGSIGLCLFPLWPATIRLGVYYLSVAAAGFLVILLALAVLRLIIFALCWGITMGNHHFWLFPNLLEDVGFFESFWPLYLYEYKGVKSNKKKDNSEDATKSNLESKKEESEHDSQSEQNSENDQTDNSFEVLNREELSATDKEES